MRFTGYISSYCCAMRFRAMPIRNASLHSAVPLSIALRYITIHFALCRFASLCIFTLRFITLLFISFCYITLRYITRRSSLGCDIAWASTSRSPPPASFPFLSFLRFDGELRRILFVPVAFLRFSVFLRRSLATRLFGTFGASWLFSTSIVLTFSFRASSVHAFLFPFRHLCSWHQRSQPFSPTFGPGVTQ